MKRFLSVLLILSIFSSMLLMTGCAKRVDIDLTNKTEDEIYETIEKIVSGEIKGKNIKLRGSIKFAPAYYEYRYFEIKDNNLYFMTKDGKYPVSGTEADVILKYKNGVFECLQMEIIKEPDEYVDLDISEYDDEQMDKAIGYILQYMADFDNVYIKLRGIYIKEGASNIMKFNGSENWFEFISISGKYPDRGSEVIMTIKVEKDDDTLVILMQSFEDVIY